MAAYTYPAAPVLVETTGEFAIGATGVLLPSGGGSAVQVYDLNDSPISSIVVGPKGAHQAFKADISDGVLDFGSVLLPTISIEQSRAGLTAITTANAALTAATAAQAAAVAAQAAAEAAAGKFVVHGTNGSTARPTSTAPVVWFGTVDPVNSDDTKDVFVPVQDAGA